MKKMKIIYKQRKTDFIKKNRSLIPYYRVILSFNCGIKKKDEWLIVERDFIYKDLKNSRSKAIEFVKTLGKESANCKTENKGKISFKYKGTPLISIVRVNGRRIKTIVSKNNYLNIAKVLAMQDDFSTSPKLLEEEF